jgi:predicted anti-sigma-YlaC factor YlaD
VSQCAHLREQFSAYLDGAVTGAVMHEIAAHLEVCSGCSAEFAQWRNAQSLVSSIGPAKAPENLGLRLRVALSQQIANTTEEKFARERVRWQNTMLPLMWRVTAGFASTVAMLGAVALLIGMFSPEPLLARDEPLGMTSSPRFLYTSLKPAEGAADGNNPVVVQAFVNGEGRVYDYKIVSGDADNKTRSQLKDTLLFSVFAPARGGFGQPVPGTVLLSFSSVSVRG